MLSAGLIVSHIIVSHIVGRIDSTILLVLGTLAGQVCMGGYLFRRLTILMNSRPGKAGWY